MNINSLLATSSKATSASYSAYLVDNGNQYGYDLFMNPEDLIKWRTDLNLLQSELGDLLGVTKGCISRWEAGERHIPPFLALALSASKVTKGGKAKKGATETKTGKERKVKK